MTRSTPPISAMRAQPALSRLWQGLLLAALALTTADAQPRAQQTAVIDTLENHTVLVVSELIAPSGSAATATGSGFALDERHVATNAHVVPSAEDWAEQLGEPRLPELIRRGTVRLQYSVLLDDNRAAEAEIVWSSPRKDLAVLRLDGPHGRKPVTFQREAYVEKGDDVLVLGFPGAAMRDLNNLADPSLSRGTLSRFAEDPPGRRLYQTDASINSGNSGGPMFSACGRLIGINVEESVGVDGIAWAVRADELMEELPALGIAVQEVEAPCGAAAPGADVASMERIDLPWWLWAGAVALVGIVALMFILKPRVGSPPAAAGPTPRPDGGRPAPAAPAAVQTAPVVRMVAGPYEGLEIEIGDTPLIIGREPNSTDQIALPPDTPGISKRHCSVRFDRGRQAFVVEDAWSRYGTFLENGRRIQPDAPETLRPGQRFYLCDRDTLFEVGHRS